MPDGVAYVGSQTCNGMSLLTPGGHEVSSEGVGRVPPGVGTLAERGVDIFPGASITPSESFYPGQVSRVIRPPTSAVMRGTAAEFVEKGMVTDPTVPVKPAP